MEFMAGVFAVSVIVYAVSGMFGAAVVALFAFGIFLSIMSKE